MIGPRDRVICVRAIQPGRERFVGQTGWVTMWRPDADTAGVMVVFDTALGAQQVHMLTSELEAIA